MKHKVLVTGGAGFLGSHLCRRLLEKGFSTTNYVDKDECEVICLDNLYTGSLNNIEDLLKNSRFKFIKGDITNTYWIEHNKDLKGVTHIFNAACPASPVHYQGKYAIKTTLSSVLGINNMLNLALQNNAKILQFSTSEVYGDPVGHPIQSEEYKGNVNCIGPRSCYDEGKRCAESLCFDYNRTYGTKIKIVRIFNTYGPYMNKNDGRVISNFICQALKNKDITIYGDGSQTRSFCYVDDLIDGIIRMMNSDDSVTGPINLGNPFEKYTMSQIANIVLDLIPDSTSKVILKTLPKDDPTERQPDISKAELNLAWAPKTSLIRGLIYSIRYFEKVLNTEE